MAGAKARSEISGLKSKGHTQTSGNSHEDLEKKFRDMVKAARKKSDKLMKEKTVPFAMTPSGFCWLKDNPRAAIAIMALGTLGTFSVMSQHALGSSVVVLEPARQMVESFFSHSGVAASTITSKAKSQISKKALELTGAPQKWAEATYGAFASRIISKLTARKK